MTRVDIVSILLKELPFHSLFRGSTEGGEHCHYLHQCIYYGHSSRGGGWRKEEPILSLFKWSYRRLREKIEQQDKSGDFVTFVQDCFAKAGRSYCDEFGGQPPDTQSVTNTPLQTDCTATDRIQPIETSTSSPLRLHDSPLADRSQSPDTPVSDTQLPADNPVIESPHPSSTEYRRGKIVYFSNQQSSEVAKGIVVNLTPQKRHVKLATCSKTKAITVPLESFQAPPPQPLKGQHFVITGNIAEHGERVKVNTEKLTELIKNLGGTVFMGDVTKAVDASFTIVTSQKEVDKPTQKLDKTLVTAYRLGWKIISKKLILEAKNTNTLPPVSNYELDLTNIRNAPATSVIHARILTNSSMINNHHIISGHRELKKKLRGNCPKRKKPDNITQEKRLPKRPCTGYTMFLRSVWKSIVQEHPHFSMREVNSLVSEMWQKVGIDDRRMYQQQAQEDFENCIENYHTLNRQHQKYKFLAF